MRGWAGRPAAIMAGPGAGAKSCRLRRTLVARWAVLLWFGLMGEAATAADAAIAREIAAQVQTEVSALRDFYAAREHRPAWRRVSTVAALSAALLEFREDGLGVAGYAASELLEQRRRLDQGIAEPAAEAAYDLRVSRIWLAALRDLRFGRARPATWEAAPALPDMAAISRDVDVEHLAQTVARLRPGDEPYQALRAGLARYRAYRARGGWLPLPEGGVLRQGMLDERVALLRARLDAEGRGTETRGDPAYFDAELTSAVRDFQRRHLLTVDGVVGSRTRAALNVSAAARVAQLRVALERRRWLAPTLPATHVLVDIAGYRLQLVRDGEPRWQARVVVGRPSRPTPSLRAEISSITFNPSWTVPPTILREDVLPRVRRDPGYLAREGIEVMTYSGERVSPGSVDWARPGRVLLRQRPGGNNPLGRVVIRFPNRHLVYLHDTPTPELFELESPAISSGCVRVEHALALVRRLLDDGRHWDREEIQAVVDAGQTRRVNLPRPMPLLLWYRTVGIGPTGDLLFYPDIYDRDAAVLSALE